MCCSILQHLRFISEICTDSQLSLKASLKCTCRFKSFKLNFRLWFWHNSDLYWLKSFLSALLKFLLMKSILKANVNVTILCFKICWYVLTLLPSFSSVLPLKCLKRWSMPIVRVLYAMPIGRKLDSKLTCRLRVSTLLFSSIAAFRSIISISIWFVLKLLQWFICDFIKVITYFMFLIHSGFIICSLWIFHTRLFLWMWCVKHCWIRLVVEILSPCFLSDVKMGSLFCLNSFTDWPFTASDSSLKSSLTCMTDTSVKLMGSPI